MSNAVAARKDERARRKAERMMEKQREAAEHDLPRSMRPSPITKTITVIVLFLGLQRYWQAGLAAGAVKG